MKNFQTILMIVFGVFIVGAVMVFSGVIKVGGGSNTQVQTVEVSMWGSIPSNQFSAIMRASAEAGEKLDINYTEKEVATFENELVNALASGKGPDLILAPHTLLLHQADKLYPIPVTALPERTFKDNFVQGSEVLMRAAGTLGLPVYTDPLVMYWNRDMLTRAGIATPPTSWIELQRYPEKLTKVDSSGAITSAAVAMGGTTNVTHFKEIINTQIMQGGDAIVRRAKDKSSGDEAKDAYTVKLASTGAAPSALRYYGEFGNPALPKYSWNSAKKNSLDEFIAGNLAIYFGLARDLPTIRGRNPHLGFDVALTPQVTPSSASGQATKLTYTDVYALAMLKNSPHIKDAFAVAYAAALGKTANIFSVRLGLSPARRDLLGAGNVDPILTVFYNSAIIGKTWPDPSDVVTRNIFSSMVESVMIGKSTPEEAVSVADTQLRNLF